MQKNIYVNCRLGSDWWKVQRTSKKPSGENHTHFSLQFFPSWDVDFKAPSCAGRRFDESQEYNPDDYLTEFMKDTPTDDPISCSNCKKLKTFKGYYDCDKRGYMGYGETHSQHYCNSFKKVVRRDAIHI